MTARKPLVLDAGTSEQLDSADQLEIPAGTAALPSLTFSDLNTGIYASAADEVAIATGGTQRIKVASNGFTVGASFALPLATTSSGITLDATRDTSVGGFTVTLPDASTCSRRIYVVKNVGGNAVTIQANGAQTIDGSNTRSLAAQWDRVMIQSDGASAWFVIG